MLNCGDFRMGDIRMGDSNVCEIIKYGRLLSMGDASD